MAANYADAVRLVRLLLEGAVTSGLVARRASEPSRPLAMPADELSPLALAAADAMTATAASEHRDCCHGCDDECGWRVARRVIDMIDAEADLYRETRELVERQQAFIRELTARLAAAMKGGVA